MATISMPVFSFRRIPTPFEDQNSNKQNAIAVVSVKDLPDFSEWRKVNPREVNRSSHVAKAIAQTLGENPDFFFINRGLVLTVDNYEFDQKGGILHLHFTNEDVHGLLDGGHTHAIIMEERNKIDETGLNQYVKIEILTGFPATDAVTVVEGRNTSNQVKPKSIANLNRAFDTLKEAIRGTRYEKLVSYVENQEGAIDIRELISFLYIFANLNSKFQPIAAYQAKAACLDDFLADFDNDLDSGVKYRPVYAIAQNIFELWDYIHEALPILYSKSRGGGRFGGLSGVSGTKGGETLTQLHFIGRGSPFKIPAAMKYPILAAFRAFVEMNPETGDYQWAAGIDPLEMLSPDSELGAQIADRVGASIRETRNPSKTGRDKSLWENCYQAARIMYLERKANLTGN